MPRVASSLRRTFPFDPDRAFEGLRDRTFRAYPLGDQSIGIAFEPLLRRGESGLEQSMRVRADPAPTYAEVTTPDGEHRVLPAEPAPHGARLLVPASDEPTIIRVRFPELGEATLDVQTRPVRRWELSLVHHSHLDVGYTDLQGRVIAEQLSYLDDVLRLADASVAEGTDSPSSFHWAVESIAVLHAWVSRRTPDVVARFMDHVRSARIELGALPYNMHTEVCSTEELHGLLRYAHEISERFQVDIPLAYQTDVPGCVAGTVDALAGAGVRYLAVAHNWGGKAVPYLGDGLHLPRLFRWASPGGASVLVWQTTTAEGMAYQEGANLGFYDSIEHVEDLLPLYLLSEETHAYAFDDGVFGFPGGDQDFDREPYPWNELHLRVMGRIGDNSPPNRRLNEIVRAWNERWEYPKLTVTRSQDFFEVMESRHAEEIQTYVGDWNDWWADGLGSAARHIQLNREAQNELPQATVVRALLADRSIPGFERRVDEARTSIELFDEHTWGAANPTGFGDAAQRSGVDQWHWKAEKAIRAQQESGLLAQEALRAFAEKKGGTRDASIWIVNTEGAARGGLVLAFLPESLVHSRASIRLEDPRSGRGIPFAERNQLNPVHRTAGRFLEFVVDDVAAVGSRRVDVIVVDEFGRPANADGTVDASADAADVWHLDNGVVRVEIDARRGWITSIRELASGVELVDGSSAFGFNAYVHDRLGNRGGFDRHLSGFFADHGPDLVLLADRTTNRLAAFEDAGRDAVSTWVRFRTFADGVESIVTTIRLVAGSGAVDIENRVVKPFTLDKESGFFAFPFDLHDPVARYEITGSVAGSDIEHVPGGAHYVHAVRDWVALQRGDRAAALVSQDAPLVQLGDIALPFPPFPGTLPRREPGTVFSWIHNNIWDTNFPTGQALDMVFRYRVAGFAAGAPEAAGVLAADLSASLVRPLLAVAADPVGVLEEEDALLGVDDTRIRVLSLRAEADGGYLVALQSLAESEVTAVVTVGRDVRGARRASLAGAEGETLTVRDGRHVDVVVPAFGTTAVRLELA